VTEPTPIALADVTCWICRTPWPGPFASTRFADFGASVITIEPPGTGEIARLRGPPFYRGETAYFVP
jgi:crotonobetainyl-CoA:carnitine CoA-transferase CaiB-like acyl-CoA transferase